MRINAQDFPLILAGPILRRVTSHSVSVFLALKERRWVQLKLYNDPNTFPGGSFEDNPIGWHTGFEYPLHPAIRLGEHLYVVVATVKIPEWFNDGTADGQPIAGLQPGMTYGYNIFFHTTQTDTGESISLAQTAFDLLTTNNPKRLGYEPERLPSFSLPPSDFGQLNIVHGSCRKPHGEGTDMLAKLDDYLAHNDLYKDPIKRPHLLLLTGDQIYADDVDPILLWLLHRTSRTLLGWEEIFPDTDQKTDSLRGILQTLSEAAHEVANTVEGQPLPDLLGAIQQAIGAINDPIVGSTLKRQLTVFADTLEGLAAAAQGVVAQAIHEFATELAGWIDKHREIFSNLSSHHHWGQPGVPKTEANNTFIHALKSELANIMTPVSAAQAAGVAAQLANNLNPEFHPNITGDFFRDKLGHFFTRAHDLVTGGPANETAVNGLVGELREWIEDEDIFEYVASRISPPQRTKELKQFAGLTSGAMMSHLMFLGEFYMMYLFTWSDAMWPRDEENGVRLPEFFDAVPNYGLTGELSKSSLKEAREGLARFASSIAKVRRVLANIPTLMMFDDHEVTDDWNLNMDWVVSVNKSVMGPQVLRNALGAYAVFQDWGNQPEDYEDYAADDRSVAGRRILEALTMPDPPSPPDPTHLSPSEPAPPPAPPPMVDLNDTATRSIVNALFGTGPEIAAQLPTVTGWALSTTLVGTTEDDTPLVGTTEGDYAMVKPGGRKIWDWEYQPDPTATFKIISLDTRNHRAFPTRQWAARAKLPITAPYPGGPQIGGYVAAANLIQPEELTRQLTDRFQEGILHFVISPAPMFGLPLVEDLFQRLLALSSGPEVADFESWQGNPDGFRRLLEALHGPDIILISGDVHYAYSNILTIYNEESGPLPQPIMQVCSSSFKNETGQTRFIGGVGREGRLVDWWNFSNLRESLGILKDQVDSSVEDIRESFGDTLSDLGNFGVWVDETAPMLNPLNPGSYVTYYLALKDTLLLDVDMLTPAGLFAIGSPAVRYFFMDMIIRSVDPESQKGVYRHEGRTLQFLADTRDHATRLAQARQLNNAAVLNSLTEPEFKLKQQAEVVGFNNFGKISFSPDTSPPPLERVSHELFWVAHGRDGKPETVLDDEGNPGNILASTIHGYIPKILSFREEIVRVAKAELNSWTPPNAPRLTESTPQGLALLEQYHALLKPENEALKAITPPAGEPFIGFYGPRGGHEEGPILHWSAVFISFVLKAAGAGNRFFYSPRHIDYVRRAKHNRSDDPTNPFHLYDLTEDGATPAPGDLVVQWRTREFSYNNVETDDLYFDRHAHVDVVVAVSSSSIETIGGNLGNSVDGRTFTLQDGRLRAEDHFIGIIKLMGAP